MMGDEFRRLAMLLVKAQLLGLDRFRDGQAYLLLQACRQASFNGQLVLAAEIKRHQPVLYG